MKWQTTALALASSIVLTACFLSGEARIQTGTLLADGPVSFCTDDDPPCQTGFPDGDGYIIYSGDPEEEDTRLRFEVLTGSGASTVYIGEAELRDDSEPAWAYVLVRASAAPGDGFPQFDLILPSCNDGDDAAHSAYGILRSDAYTCEVRDFAAFRTYLIETYSGRFSDPAFWRESAAD
jgi:hypothetical protein